MDQLEKVEKLRAKANVSYEEAKEALEANNWDILDAVVYLEKAGKVHGPKETTYSTHFEESSKTEEFKTEHRNSSSFSEVIGKFFGWCGRIIKKGNENDFLIERNNEKPVTIPVTVLILMAIFFPWVTFPLIVIGLFFGFRYSFRGPDLDKKPVNDFMDKASETVDSIKEDFKNGFNK